MEDSDACPDAGIGSDMDAQEAAELERALSESRRMAEAAGSRLSQELVWILGTRKIPVLSYLIYSPEDQEMLNGNPTSYWNTRETGIWNTDTTRTPAGRILQHEDSTRQHTLGPGCRVDPQGLGRTEGYIGHWVRVVAPQFVLLYLLVDLLTAISVFLPLACTRVPSDQ